MSFFFIYIIVTKFGRSSEKRDSPFSGPYQVIIPRRDTFRIEYRGSKGSNIEEQVLPEIDSIGGGTSSYLLRPSSLFPVGPQFMFLLFRKCCTFHLPLPSTCFRDRCPHTSSSVSPFVTVLVSWSSDLQPPVPLPPRSYWESKPSFKLGLLT